MNLPLPILILIHTATISQTGLGQTETNTQRFIITVSGISRSRQCYTCRRYAWESGIWLPQLAAVSNKVLIFPIYVFPARTSGRSITLHQCKQDPGPQERLRRSGFRLLTLPKRLKYHFRSPDHTRCSLRLLQLLQIHPAIALAQ